MSIPTRTKRHVGLAFSRAADAEDLAMYVSRIRNKSLVFRFDPKTSGRPAGIAPAGDEGTSPSFEISKPAKFAIRLQQWKTATHPTAGRNPDGNTLVTATTSETA